MKFQKPRLPYSPDSLSPVISQSTVEYHYGKHEQAYIDTLNALIEGTPFQDMSLEEIICRSDGKLYNNASQAWNHIFYFFQFSPDGIKEPAGKLREQIDRQFGGFDDFRKEIEQAGVALFGSGWVWVSSDEKGHLIIKGGSNAYNPMTEGLRPIFVVDVWEHAYYLDYQNRRAEYLSRLWDLVDWRLVEARYE